MSFFQFVQGTFDRSFLVCRKLVAKIFQLLLSLEDHAIRLIQLVDTLFLFLIGLCVRSSFFFHTLNFVVAQTAGSLDTDTLYFAGSFILSGYVQYTVSVYIECNLDLRNTTLCGRYSIQVETTDRLVIFSQRTLTLQDVDLNRRLIVYGSRKCLGLLGRDCRVRLDQFSHYTTHCLNT